MNYLSFFIAYRFLKYRPFRTMLIIMGVAIGIAVQLFVGVIIDSTQANLIKRTLGYSSHITIKPYENDKINTKIKRPELIVSQILDNNSNFTKIIFSVEEGVTILDFNQKLQARGRLIGFNNFLGDDIFGIKENLTIGDYLLGNNYAVIGSKIRDSLRLELGDYIILKNSRNKYLGAKVMGVFNSGNQQLDSYVVMNIDTVKNFLGYSSSEYSAILSQVENIFKSDKIKNSILEFYRAPYEITEWKESNKQLLRGLAAQSSSGLFIQLFILFSIAISTFSLINTKIMEKYKEIGILKALGMNNSNIIRIFVNIAFILGFSGVMLGLLVSIIMLTFFVNFTKDASGNPIFNLVFKTFNIFLTILFDVFIIVLAGYLSSRRVVKIEPAQIIVGG